MYRILFAEDDETTRLVVASYLRESGFDVVDVPDGAEALELLRTDSAFDLVFSDIEMPKIQGHILLKRVEELFPSMKRVLLTGHSIEQYLGIAMQFGISNVITKTTPLNLKSIADYLNNLLSGELFGVERYLDEDAETMHFDVTNPKQIESHIRTVIEHYGLEDNGTMEQAFIEILTNAVYYGILGEDGSKKSEWDQDVQIVPGDVVVASGMDSEKIAVSISDKGGKLDKNRVYFWLARQIRKDANGLPLGIRDQHGRGIFISRECVDRLIVNIERGKRTEIICLKYLNEEYDGPKPLLINEI